MKEAAVATLGSGEFGDVFLVLHEGVRCALKVGKSLEMQYSMECEAKRMEELAGAGGAPLPMGICPEVPALLMTCVGDMDLLNYV